MKIRKSDIVLIITGKDKGKKGKVRFVFPDNERLLVEGINFVKKHTKARKAVKQAGILEREEPIHRSNVMLICSKCDHPVQVGYRILDGDKKVRFCRSCKEILD